MDIKLNIQKAKIMAFCPTLHGKQMGKKWKQWQTLFSWNPKSLWMVIAAMKLKEIAPWKKGYDKLRHILKSRYITLSTNVHIVKAIVFPVVMYWHEYWTIKKAECGRIYSFELWYWKNQPCLFIGGTDAEVKAPIRWPPDAKNQFTGKDPIAGKDWGQEEKGTTKDKVVWWHHWLSGINLSKFWKIVKDRDAWHATGLQKESDTAVNEKKTMYMYSWFTMLYSRNAIL